MDERGRQQLVACIVYSGILHRQGFALDCCTIHRYSTQATLGSNSRFFPATGQSQEFRTALIAVLPSLPWRSELSLRKNACAW